MFNTQRVSIRIPKLFLIETRPVLNSVYSRGYSLNANYGTLNKLNQMVTGANSFGAAKHTMTEIDVVNKIPEVINLDPMPTKVNIVNGWNTPRARFLMAVESMMGEILITTYIQGYTDYIDNSIYGKMDPNMKLIMNSVVMTMTTRDPVYGKEFVTRQAYYNIIPDELGKGGVYQELDQDMNTKKLVRPEDVLNSLFLDERHEGLGATVINMADELTTSKVSNKLNSSMVKYFSRITTAFIDAKNIATNQSDRLEILANARSAVYEPDITKNPFIVAMYDLTGTMMISKFSLGDLTRLDPGVRPTFFPRENTPMVPFDGVNSMMETDDVADTLQPLPETLKANMIANELPSYMCECMVTNLVMSMTNMNGENIAIPTHIQTFVDRVDAASWIEPLLAKVRLLLKPKLSDGGMTIFDAHVVADVLGEITISISLYGGHPVIYRYPCYADSLYSPVVTNRQNKEILVNDFQNILDQTYTNY